MSNSHANTPADRPDHGTAAGMCAEYEAGYELNPIQRQAAIATASRWRDATVSSIDAGGWIELIDLDTQKSAWVWHYVSLAPILSVGEPVSLHGLYSVLAVGSRLFSVRPAATVE